MKEGGLSLFLFYSSWLFFVVFFSKNDCISLTINYVRNDTKKYTCTTKLFLMQIIFLKCLQVIYCCFRHSKMLSFLHPSTMVLDKYLFCKTETCIKNALNFKYCTHPDITWQFTFKKDGLIILYSIFTSFYI